MSDSGMRVGFSPASSIMDGPTPPRIAVHEGQLPLQQPGTLPASLTACHLLSNKG